MNGFNSKVIHKNSSVTIWEILFNITIPIIHHKYRGGFATTGGGEFRTMALVHPGVACCETPCWGVPRGRFLKTFHRSPEKNCCKAKRLSLDFKLQTVPCVGGKVPVFLVALINYPCFSCLEKMNIPIICFPSAVATLMQ